jgi:hypothetical protein
VNASGCKKQGRTGQECVLGLAMHDACMQLTLEDQEAKVRRVTFTCTSPSSGDASGWMG